MDADAAAGRGRWTPPATSQHSNLPYGENIAWWSAGQASPEAAAELMHDLWVGSAGHYGNMTNAGYTSMGVGFWRSDSGGWHATHVFSN